MTWMQEVLNDLEMVQIYGNSREREHLRQYVALVKETIELRRTLERQRRVQQHAERSSGSWDSRDLE